MRNRSSIPVVGAAMLLLALLSCNLPAFGGSDQPGSDATQAPPLPLGAEAGGSELDTPTATATTAVVHTLTPPAAAAAGKPIYDVDSFDTAAEKRAPYGDSYDINRLEREFSQDMTYLPDIDIGAFSLTSDQDFYFVSIDLIGVDPNNPMGIQYGVELDSNADGFGDFIVVGRPPFTTDWSTTGVQVYGDSNHDTAGRSGEKADAPITTDGYDQSIFDGAASTNSDPDLAWVRMNAGEGADLQFAFKKSWAGSSFMYGVIADAGLKDVGKLDYVDRFTEAEAGSPVKDKKYYPLGALFAVDNTCRQEFGFKPTGYEPMLCPRDLPNPTKRPHATPIPPTPVPPPIP